MGEKELSVGDFSINSPRRILTISRNRAKSYLDPEEKVSGFAVSEEHGPKPSEVYGFVGSISTVVATDVIRYDNLTATP